MKLKKWVTDLLIIIAFISIMIITGECEKNLLFFLKAIIGTFIFTTCNIILIKYGRI